ncbi:MAG: hypothetical protein AB7O96_12805 [Pseudobdellovibrionaceae bacterium]
MKQKTILNFLRILASGGILFSLFSAHANQPKVGRSAAAKYFQEDSKRKVATSQGYENRYEGRSGGGGDRVLMLHAGTYTSSESFYWTRSGRIDDVATNTFGLTYRMDAFTDSMDSNLRVDFTSFKFKDKDVDPLKMSLVYLITFPDAASAFPLYFGLGGGPGVFFRQIKNESNLSFDYQLVAGARFMNITGGAGFFVESGLKNHVHLLSDGQINGVFLAGGAIFTF